MNATSKDDSAKSIAFQTGHTKRNGRGWDDWEVSYTLNLATDFAVCVIRGIGKSATQR